MGCKERRIEAWDTVAAAAASTAGKIGHFQATENYNSGEEATVVPVEARLADLLPLVHYVLEPAPTNEHIF